MFSKLKNMSSLYAVTFQNWHWHWIQYLEMKIWSMVIHCGDTSMFGQIKQPNLHQHLLEMI